MNANMHVFQVFSSKEVKNMVKSSMISYTLTTVLKLPKNYKIPFPIHGKHFRTVSPPKRSYMPGKIYGESSRN